MSGADQHLTRNLLQWNLSKPVLLANTPTSHIFEVLREEEPLILKIFTELGMQDEGKSEEVLSIWNGCGAVQVIASDPSALLFEKLEDPNLYDFSERNQEDTATEIFVQIIQKIHSVSIPNKHSLPDLFHLLAPMQNFDHQQLLPFQRAFEIGLDLLKTESRKVLLHGDLHHENVLRRKNGDYVCFDPKGFIGDPCYEIAAILRNPWAYPKISEDESTCIHRANTFSKLLNLPLDRILKFAFVQMCLSVMWAVQDGRDYNHQLKIARFLEKYTS